MTSPSSSNTLKTLEEIETELSDIEEEIRLLDEEEKEAKEKVRLGKNRAGRKNNGGSGQD